MPAEPLSDLCVALTFLRSGQGWTQAELAAASGISPKHLNDYERGWRKLTREKLEHLIAFMGLPPETIDSTLACLAANRAAGRAPRDAADDHSETQRRVEVVAARAGKLMAGFARSVLSLVAAEGEALKARLRGESLWGELKRRPAAGSRRLLVKKGMKFRDWGLCVRVAAESLERAANQPREAQELAELAVLIAELAPGTEAWRSRLQGYAWAHLANGRRVCQNLPGANEALARARKLWQAGAAADPGLLNAAVLPWIEAAVRRGERRFPEALKQIEAALALDPGELRGKILITKSAIFQILAEPEASAAALSEASPLIDAGREPRLALVLQFNLVVDLCHLARYAEAELRLPAVRALAERLGEELDLTRVVWLEGKAAAGLGRTGEAEAALGQARRVFRQRELVYDYALVSLELSLLLLEQGRSAEVRKLAEEMLWIFRAQGVERETLAALRVFCDAARGQTATGELAHRVLDYLYRARFDSELPFEAGGGAEAQ
jgi:transcriptional regulator with XRE-family HTH domain